MSIDRKMLLGIAAAVIAVVVAVVATVMVMGNGHMSGDAWRGDMPAATMSADDPHAGHMGGDSGSGWDGPRMQMGAMPGMRMTPSGAMAMDESAFIAMMIPHHQMAVQMARDVLERGSDAGVRAMAEAVIADQEEEIALMRAWHRDWFGTEPPVMPMSGAMAMMGMAMDHQAIRIADDPDLAFVDAMVPHHAGALLMADMVLAGDPRADLAGLARRIIDAQSREIGEMAVVRERIA